MFWPSYWFCRGSFSLLYLFIQIFFCFLCRNPLILCRESYVPKILQMLKDLYIHSNCGINVKCLWYDSLSKLQLYTALRFKGNHNDFHEPSFISFRLFYNNFNFCTSLQAKDEKGWQEVWWNFALRHFLLANIKWLIVNRMWFKCLEGWILYFFYI